jgi:hypothetical protein
MTHHEHPNVTVVREGFEAMQRGDTAWMDEHLADDVVWHVGGNSKWAGAYQGKAQVLDFFARQAQAMGGPSTDEVRQGRGPQAPGEIALDAAPLGDVPRDHREQAAAVHQHQAHLQQHFQPLADRGSRNVPERFDALACLQDEGATLADLAEPGEENRSGAT